MQDEGDRRHWLPSDANGKRDVVTAARRHRKDVVATESDRGGREFRSLDSPLEFYVARGQITGRQYRAGKRLHVLWVKGTPSPFVQVRYEEGDGVGKTTSFIPLGMAATEYREALYSITGKDQRTVVHAVCCDGIAASRCLPARSQRTAERRSMELLRAALDALAAHFKYD